VVANMVTLSELDLSNNKFKDFSSGFFNSLTILSSLSLSSNKLESLPLESGLPQSLVNFYCSDCRLEGDFPSVFHNYTNLQNLDLSNNNFEGEISSKQALTAIQNLDLSDNDFYGPMPAWFGNVTTLKLNGNHFRCPVPSNVHNQSCTPVAQVTDVDPICIDTDVDTDVVLTLTGENFIDSNSLVCKFGGVKPAVEAKYGDDDQVTCTLDKSVIRARDDGSTISVKVANYGADYGNSSTIWFRTHCQDSGSSSGSKNTKGIAGWAVALTVIMVLAFVATVGVASAYYYIRWRRQSDPSGSRLLDQHENL